MKVVCGNTNVIIESRDVGGRILQRQEQHNRMVQTGRSYLRDLLQGVRAAPTYIACGVLDPIDVDDAADSLLSELSRVECHSRIVQDNKAIFMASFDRAFIYSHDYWDIREFGLFAGCGWTTGGDPDTGGVMLCQVRCSPIDVSDHMTSIFVVWEIPLFAE